MADVALIGHLTIDTIFTDGVPSQRLGGIANVWQGLLMSDPEVSVDLYPIQQGQAIIWEDVHHGKRYSTAVLNQRSHQYDIRPAQINLISYLNELPDQIPAVTGMVCADICAGKPLTADRLAGVDLLFVADTEIPLLPDNVSCRVIYHSPSQSWDNQGHRFQLPAEQMLQDVRVLGAGDWYAANYIIALLHGLTPSQCLAQAHTKTTQMLGAYK